jgi:hypothetical protein
MNSDLDKRFTTVMKYHDGSAPVRLVGHLVICERTVNLLFCETVTGALILTGVLSWPGREAASFVPYLQQLISARFFQKKSLATNSKNAVPH